MLKLAVSSREMSSWLIPNLEKDVNYLDSVYRCLMGSSEEGTRLFSVVPKEVINRNTGKSI